MGDAVASATMSLRYLPPVVPETGEPPEDIGTGHPMREVTEQVARDPGWWGPEHAAQVTAAFDSLAPGWDAGPGRSGADAALADALDRGGPVAGPVLELGAGTGAGTRLLRSRFGHVVAGDLSNDMLARLDPALASRVRLDASGLPVRPAAVGAVVCVNMLLFADEVRRVLRAGGSLVWVNTLGERTPIHLPAEAVAAALGDDVDVVASRAGWSTWAVARLP